MTNVYCTSILMFIKSSTINNTIKWIALFVTIAGAISNAFLLVPYNVILGNIGAMLYMTWAIRTGDWNIALVNFILMFIYAAGLFTINK